MQIATGMRALLVPLLISLSLGFITLANISFKWSALSPDWRGFLFWQIVGNLSGFLNVLAFTFALRYIPLSIGYAFVGGLGFVLIQVVGAHFVFHENISAGQWLGVAFIAVGLVLISLMR